MKRLLIAALLAAAPTAQFNPSCVGLSQQTEYGVTFSQLSYYQYHVRFWSHVEFVPTAYGICLMCLFQGGPRSSVESEVVRVAQFHSPLPGCNWYDQVPVYRHAVWWMDAAPMPNESVWQCGRWLRQLSQFPTATLWTPRTIADPLCGPEDLFVMQDGVQGWTRRPTYWGILIQPARGWW